MTQTAKGALLACREAEAVQHTQAVGTEGNAGTEGFNALGLLEHRGAEDGAPAAGRGSAPSAAAGPAAGSTPRCRLP